MAWYWLSFVSPTPSGPRGHVSVVEAMSLEQALDVAAVVGAEPTDPPPGSHVLCVRVPDEVGPPPAAYAMRLLSMEEAAEMTKIWTPDTPGIRTVGQAAAAGHPLALEILGEDAS